jgi:hypothetical protein
MTALDEHYTANPLVVAQATPEGTVLMDMATGECFELNGTGSKIWLLLTKGESLSRTVGALAAAHGLAVATVESDVRSLVTELTRRGLVTPANP